ncbi:unnamed protein product, partial [Amoebophrya sp. A120]
VISAVEGFSGWCGGEELWCSFSRSFSCFGFLCCSTSQSRSIHPAYLGTLDLPFYIWSANPGVSDRSQRDVLRPLDHIPAGTSRNLVTIGSKTPLRRPGSGLHGGALPRRVSHVLAT